MEPKVTVQTLLSAVQKGDFKTVKSLATGDFQFSGPVPEPINGEQLIGMFTSLKAAFPSIDYHHAIEGADGNVVHISTQISGTHTGDFDLTAMGMSVIPATGKSISMAHEYADVTVGGDKVVSWKVQPTEGAGLLALLSQLGVALPAK